MDRALRRALAPVPGEPTVIREAMRYSVHAGGKRLRPMLVLAAAEACNPRAARRLRPALLEAAAAVELLHTYSLIHDDLPAMDNDDFRRGLPTSHKKFGEAMAILAGDALLTRVFERLAGIGVRHPALRLRALEVVRVVAEKAGSGGLIGGQVVDLQAAGGSPVARRGRPSGRPAVSARRTIQYIHLHKTAAMIQASLDVGAILVGASPIQRRTLQAYGREIGLAFQIMDDVLDLVGDKAKLGKRGSDLDNLKLTWPAIHGLEPSKLSAGRLAAGAVARRRWWGGGGRRLADLAGFIVRRDH